MNSVSGCRNVLSSAVAALTLTFSAVASANNVVYEDVDFFEGKGSSSESFHIDTTGLYQATLTDFQFPSSFSGNFALGVATGGNSMVGTTNGSGSFTFQAAPGTYWANVYGVTAGPLDLGLYGIRIEQIMATPLPTAMLLLFSGLVALVGVGRGGARLTPPMFPLQATA